MIQKKRKKSRAKPDKQLMCSVMSEVVVAVLLIGEIIINNNIVDDVP